MERSLTHRALAALSLAASAALALPAQAGPALVADIDSGRVLYAEDATQPWHPASVTKLMTVYVALRALADGQIGLQTAIPVSKRASLAPPSKIRLKPGQEITLENALKIMMVKSANDVAITIAEGVGGTVENFAAMMNAEAQRLGMTDSHFINPNGLFAAGQQSSARDMALLARALLTEFADYAALYSIGAVKLGDVVMLNTNGLIGRYPGADGMKTGFICASGFNVVATASRNGRRVVAVVFGEPSAQKRTIKASQLFDRAFNGELSRGPQLAALQRVGGTPPNLREDICVKRIGREPSESDAPATLTPGASQDDSSRPIMMTSNGAAFATGPREEFTPIHVFIGPSPGSKNAPMAANRKTMPATQTATADKAEPHKAGSSKAKPEAAPSAKADTKQKPAANPKPAASTTTKKPTPAAAATKPAAAATKPAAATTKPAAKPAAANTTPQPATPAAAEQGGGVKPATAKESAQPAPDNVGGIGISQSGPASFRGTLPAPSAPKAAPSGGAGPLVLPGAAAPVPSQLVRPAPAQPALKPATDP